MKIVLINPPQFFSKSQVASSVVPPLSLMYLASVLIRKNYNVKIIDSVIEAPNQYMQLSEHVGHRGLSFEQIDEKIDEDTDIIGISNLFSFAFPIVVELVNVIKNKRKKIPIVLGGAHPSAKPEDVLSLSRVDYVIIGEGEQSFIDLCSYILKEKNITEIDGVAYRKGNIIKINPKKEYIRNINALPFPNRSLFKLEDYFLLHEGHGPIKDKWTPILTSRGCPFSCTFCTSLLWNFRWRGRHAKNVIEEIKHCINKYNINEFHFEDENLTIDKNRIAIMCSEIIRLRLDIRWQTPNGIRADIVNRKMLALMKKSGCSHITIAPESGSLRVLEKIMDKRLNLKAIESAVRYASELDIRIAAYFVLGVPGEKLEDIKETIEFGKKLAKLGLDEAVFSLFIPLPGSKLFSLLEKQGKNPGRWDKMISIQDLGNAVSWSDYMSDKELFKARQDAYLAFHKTKSIYHPLKVIRTIFNVVLNREELKTERVLISFVNRYLKGSIARLLRF